MEAPPSSNMASLEVQFFWKMKSDEYYLDRRFRLSGAPFSLRFVCIPSTELDIGLDTWCESLREQLNARDTTELEGNSMDWSSMEETIHLVELYKCLGTERFFKDREYKSPDLRRTLGNSWEKLVVPSTNDPKPDAETAIRLLKRALEFERSTVDFDIRPSEWRDFKATFIRSATQETLSKRRTKEGKRAVAQSIALETMRGLSAGPASLYSRVRELPAQTREDLLDLMVHMVMKAAIERAHFGYALGERIAYDAPIDPPYTLAEDILRGLLTSASPFTLQRAPTSLKLFRSFMELVPGVRSLLSDYILECLVTNRSPEQAVEGLWSGKFGAHWFRWLELIPKVDEGLRDLERERSSKRLSEKRSDESSKSSTGVYMVKDEAQFDPEAVLVKKEAPIDAAADLPLERVVAAIGKGLDAGCAIDKLMEAFRFLSEVNLQSLLSCPTMRVRDRELIAEYLGTLSVTRMAEARLVSRQAISARLKRALRRLQEHKSR